MLIQTETTPNPATIKFLPGQQVMESGTRDFATPEEAESSPLAEALFSLGDVEGVFFGRDFISVTAAPGSDWRDLKPQVLSVLLDHFSSGAPLFRAASAGGISIAPDAGFEDSAEDADIIAQIRELIETRVRPAVAQDGPIGGDDRRQQQDQGGGATASDKGGQDAQRHPGGSSRDSENLG